MGVASQNSTLPCAITNFPVSWPLSSPGDVDSRVYLLFPPRRHKLPPTLRERLDPHLCPQRRRFPVSRFTKRPYVALYAIGPIFLFLNPSSLPTAPSKFSSMTRFDNRPPLIPMRASARKNLIVRNVVSMLSHPVISRARWMNEIIRWWVRSLALCPDDTKQDPVVYGSEFGGVLFLAKGPRIASASIAPAFTIHSGLEGGRDFRLELT